MWFKLATRYQCSTKASRCTNHFSRHWLQDLVPTWRLISFQGSLLHNWSLLRTEPAGPYWTGPSRWAFIACFNLDVSSGLHKPWRTPGWRDRKHGSICLEWVPREPNRTLDVDSHQCWKSVSLQRRHCGPSSQRSSSSCYHRGSVTSPENSPLLLRTWEVKQTKTPKNYTEGSGNTM